MPTTLLPVAAMGYVAGVALAAVVLLRRSRAARRVASLAWILAWTVHTIALGWWSVETGALPLSNVGGFLLTLGWAVGMLHLYVWQRLRIDVVGLLLPPIAAVTALAAWQLLPGVADGSATEQGAWMLLHTLLSTLGIAILALACSMSLIYVLQDRALKRKTGPRWLERLPALERSDQIGFQALVVGFALLTLGIGTGVVLNAELYGRLWTMGAKQLFPVLAWSVFAAILVARGALGFRGRKSAYITIVGFALGVLCVLGMRL